MSQNTLIARTSGGYSVSIVAGWDRPLQQLFVNYMDLDEVADDAPNPPGYLPNEFETVDALKAAVQDALGIELPADMLAALQQDMDSNAGNEMRTFTLP